VAARTSTRTNRRAVVPPLALCGAQPYHRFNFPDKKLLKKLVWEEILFIFGFIFIFVENHYGKTGIPSWGRTSACIVSV